MDKAVKKIKKKLNKSTKSSIDNNILRPTQLLAVFATTIVSISASFVFLLSELNDTNQDMALYVVIGIILLILAFFGISYKLITKFREHLLNDKDYRKFISNKDKKVNNVLSNIINFSTEIFKTDNKNKLFFRNKDFFLGISTPIIRSAKKHINTIDAIPIDRWSDESIKSLKGYLYLQSDIKLKNKSVRIHLYKDTETAKKSSSQYRDYIKLMQDNNVELHFCKERYYNDVNYDSFMCIDNNAVILHENVKCGLSNGEISFDKKEVEKYEKEFKRLEGKSEKAKKFLEDICPL